MNSNKHTSLKKFKNPRHGKLSHLPSIMVTSPQLNSKTITLYSDLSNYDSIPDETLSIVDVKSYYHGEFKTVTFCKVTVKWPLKIGTKNWNEINYLSHYVVMQI
ncbi:hypothetical protein LOD99_12161 [Oopsacas minuta]|uniref:Uncharacterized protein n=1 Tax=Oopsacas minuta TaxID=111878 RepID=A0AAV7JHZ6_9METZ|nr:hypothetical protein LOD99_12161 [Oopsacas minuta]